tara:strand:+ start:2125 stop:3204 length:1080 start_codon:yes stop_codon:yes gene_type:complete
MIKTYQKYLIILFLKKIFNVSLIFFSLIFILSIFEEISFFKELELSFLFLFLMTLLNAPSTLFEIFPFIFLISTQFFFLELIEKNELDVLKVNGLNNLKIIQQLALTSLVMGIILVIFFYNLSSNLKFIYLELKNSYSNDNKYLAVVNENGLWIKDEIDEKIYIINAEKIDNNFLKDVNISEFTSDFELIRILNSKKVDILSNEWKVLSPTVSENNITTQYKDLILLNTHFNRDKINGLFRNLKSLSVIELMKLKSDYKSLGYSTNEIESHLNRIYSYPIYLTIMVMLSSIIMLNIKRNKNKVFHILAGISLSVLIYYFYYLSNLFGENGSLTLITSTWLPLVILTFVILIGMVRINEK